MPTTDPVTNLSKLPSAGPRAAETATHPEYANISRIVRKLLGSDHLPGISTTLTALALAMRRIIRTERSVQTMAGSDAPAEAAMAGTATDARLPGILIALLMSNRCAPSRAARNAAAARRPGM